MTFLQLDLIVGNGQTSDESVNFEFRHAGAGNVESNASTLNGNFTSRGKNEGLKRRN